MRDASQFSGQVVQEKEENSKGDAVDLLILDEVHQRSKLLLQELVGNFSSTLLNVAKAPNWDQANVTYRPKEIDQTGESYRGPHMVGAPATGMPRPPTTAPKPVHVPAPRAQRLLDLTSGFTFMGK